MKKKRKILVVTGSRSEYDIISPILFKLNQEREIELGVIVTGPHLSETFGSTIDNITKDGFKVVDRLYNLLDTSEKIGRIVSIGNQISLLAHSLKRNQPDLVLVTGDREEAISTSMACAFQDIAIAHLAGGDIAKDGNIDNSIRYAASKFAHLHFTILPQHKENLIRMGEDEWRIHVTGNPALDKFSFVPILSDKEVSKKLGFDITGRKFALVVYHPIITEFDSEQQNVNLLLKALAKSGVLCLINSPNSDAGYKEILNAFALELSNKNFFFFKNLDRNLYVNLMRAASFMIGNSSSGIIEAPSLKLPAINVGPRQRGRHRTENVVFTDFNENEILNAIKKVQNKEFRKNLSAIKNPYGDGKASGRIVSILKRVIIDENLLHKNITY